MSLQLKHIPCPAGEKCTAFLCIFGHAKDNLSTTPLDASGGRVSGQLDERTIDDVQSDDGPRKRPRLSSDGPASQATNLKLDERSQPAVLNFSTGYDVSRKHEGTNVKDEGSKLQTIKRSISPPPLSRQTLQAPQHASRAVSISTSTPSLLNSPQTTSRRNPTSGLKKQESLNPRLVDNSPASHEIRLKLVKMLHQEFNRLNSELEKDASEDEKKLVMSEQQLIVQCLDEEQKVAVEKKAIYSNVMKNKVMQYKRMGIASWKEERIKALPTTQKKRKLDQLSGEPVKVETGLSQELEVQLLNELLTPIDQLSSFGYVATVPSAEEIAKAQDGLQAAMGYEKCDRCQQRFQVFPGRRPDDGALTSGGPCNFHWGKAYFPDKNPGEKSKPAKRFLCCGQAIGDSAGCFTHPDHVFKVTDPKRLAALMNFAPTPENRSLPKDRAVCFDCEMGYTVHGLELIRLTATVWPTEELLIDVLVQPLGEILDLNSRFSGVWPDDLAQGEVWKQGDKLTPSKTKNSHSNQEGNVLKQEKLKVVSSPIIARDLLFSQICPTTPLIGHGLENDLNAMRIVHPTLIDTVLLFPHNAGLPYRFGLKSLMSKHLNRKIQEENASEMHGHDSAEDARAAGELVRFKLMHKWQDMKRLGWKLEDGKFLNPNENGSGIGTLSEAFLES